tara:strand:+ start:51 stop:350 length:300 start_codon:yes stop_codon:yes gene_type:complete
MNKKKKKQNGGKKLFGGDTETISIIFVIVILLGGIGYYFRKEIKEFFWKEKNKFIKTTHDHPLQKSMFDEEVTKLPEEKTFTGKPNPNIFKGGYRKKFR